jgi:hypothetical protein
MTDAAQIAMLAEHEARQSMKITIIPVRRFQREGQTMFSKVQEGTMDDLGADEADCFLCHGFTVVEAAALRALISQEPTDGE